MPSVQIGGGQRGPSSSAAASRTFGFLQTKTVVPAETDQGPEIERRVNHNGSPGAAELQRAAGAGSCDGRLTISTRDDTVSQSTPAAAQARRQSRPALSGRGE